MSAENLVIETHSLTKKFNGLTAVNHINLSVKKGEIFGLLGPNGAGKTTTINMLTTIMKPTEGTAIVGGYDVTKDSTKVRSKIGIVFQENSVDRYLTGYENMWLHGKIYNVPNDVLKKRIPELLDFVELSDKRDIEVRKYSGGMLRRLEIARGLLHTPEILFLDEPTIGLDPHTRAHIWEYIKAVKEKENMTILMTTHYMDEAEKLCDRVAIIDHGKIIAIGTPDELKSSLGGDVIYIKFANNSPESDKKFIEKLQNNNFEGKVERITPENVILSVKEATVAIPRIFEIANQIDLKIKEIKYSKPTLEDVFLKLTGRKLRDESGNALELMKRMRTLRMARGRGSFHG